MHAHTHTHARATCSTSGIDGNCAKSFGQETLENIGIDEKLILKLMLVGCDWAQLWSLVRMVMNIVVSYNVVNLLAS
jgi:hypothetical protein